MRALLSFLCLFAGCAAPPALARVTLAQALAADVRSLEVMVLNAEAVDGSALDCNLLAQRDPLAVEGLQPVRYAVFARDEPIDFVDLPRGDAYFVAINAYASADATGPRIGFGCAARVRVRGGAANETAITVDPIAP